MEFYGILGEKLGHSLSPRIHKMIFETIGVEGAYKLFEVPEGKLQKFTEAMRVLKIKGANVTIPYKEEIIEYLDSLSEEAAKIGAVNTIVLEDEKLIGYNTDYYGFGYMLKVHSVDVEGKSVVILGNGGATKSIVQYLTDYKTRNITIVSRTPERGENLSTKGIKVIGYDELDGINADILINTTPIGMFPDENSTPVSDEIINNFDTIVDIVYNPVKTQLLLKAEAMGKKTVGGLLMLIGQGVKAEELWQNRAIDDIVIKDIYEVLNREFS